jgi:hypothetical protein
VQPIFPLWFVGSLLLPNLPNRDRSARLSMMLRQKKTPSAREWMTHKFDAFMVCHGLSYGDFWFLGAFQDQVISTFLTISLLFFIIKLIKESFQFMDLYESKASSRVSAFQKCANVVYGI